MDAALHRREDPAMSGSVQDRTKRSPDVDFNVNVKQMEKLIEAATRASDREVKDLAKEIKQAGIDKVTGAHSGGLGGGGREPDPNQHCTVRAGKTNYHVQLVLKNGKWLITSITK
jgi:hypothetical protein